METKRKKQIREENLVMTLEKALNLTDEEFERLSQECEEFNNEFYDNHQLRDEEETVGEFINKGCERIKNHPVIKGNLI